MLSGSAYIGQLYDAKKDQLIFDRFLWSNITTNEAEITSVQTKTYIEESIKDRTSHLGVTASLSVSLYSGLIEVSTHNYITTHQIWKIACKAINQTIFDIKYKNTAFHILLSEVLDNHCRVSIYT